MYNVRRESPRANRRNRRAGPHKDQGNTQPSAAGSKLRVPKQQEAWDAPTGRVSEGDGATVEVEFIKINIELFGTRKGLRCERFVDLHQVLLPYRGCATGFHVSNLRGGGKLYPAALIPKHYSTVKSRPGAKRDKIQCQARHPVWRMALCTHHVGKREAGFVECLVDGCDRTDAHHFGSDTSDGIADDPCHGRQAMLSNAVFRRHEHRTSTVADT